MRVFLAWPGGNYIILHVGQCIRTMYHAPLWLLLNIRHHSFTTLDPTEKVIVVLRDGRKLIGVLRSYDQYGRLPRAAL